MIRKLCLLTLFTLSIFLSGCSKSLPVYTEEVHVTIPGMEGEMKLAFLSDLHIITVNDEIAPDQKDTVSSRVSWSSYKDTSAADQWSGWVDTLNATEADYVLFGGDMVDFPSMSNIEVLKKDLDRLKIPFTYIRADHDIDDTPYLSDSVTEEDRLSAQESISELSDVYTEDFGYFIIVGWNNSTSLLTTAGLEKINEAVATNKPLILLTHVPICPMTDSSLSEASKALYSGRSLLWSQSSNYTSYFPNDTPEGNATRELLNLLYAKDSPFIEVLSGHLHTSWDGYISENVHEHVFSAAFDRYMGIITISGE